MVRGDPGAPEHGQRVLRDLWRCSAKRRRVRSAEDFAVELGDDIGAEAPLQAGQEFALGGAGGGRAEGFGGHDDGVFAVVGVMAACAGLPRRSRRCGRGHARRRWIRALRA